MKAKAKSEDRQSSDGIALVKMLRDSEDEPKTALVHPDEVDNYKKGGWTVAKD